ncbi:hypothetical protein, partial [Brevundimonas sp.]|uniref:hypothetical protein n=1 Tax=Brevundimonas sp. TaxID=1871086 RepID=UPI003FA5BBBD
MLKSRRRRLAAGAAVAGSLAVHLGILALLLTADRDGPEILVPPPPPPIVVSLHRPPPPPPPEPPPAPEP